MRAFIAIDLPLSVRNALGQVQAFFREQLRSAAAHEDSIRWARPDGIHLTLKFLGNISQDQSNRIIGLLRGFEPFERFSVDVIGYGFFPDRRRPQVFWAGLVAPPALTAVAGRIDHAIASLGLPRERRPFAPHLTLARFKTPRRQPVLEAAVIEQAGRSLGQFEVSEIFLFESQLAFGSPAQYRKIARFPAER